MVKALNLRADFRLDVKSLTSGRSAVS